MRMGGKRDLETFADGVIPDKTTAGSLEQRNASFGVNRVDDSRVEWLVPV